MTCPICHSRFTPAVAWQLYDRRSCGNIARLRRHRAKRKLLDRAKKGGRK